MHIYSSKVIFFLITRGPILLIFLIMCNQINGHQDSSPRGMVPREVPLSSPLEVTIWTATIQQRIRLLDTQKQLRNSFIVVSVGGQSKQVGRRERRTAESGNSPELIVAQDRGRNQVVTHIPCSWEEQRDSVRQVFLPEWSWCATAKSNDLVRDGVQRYSPTCLVTLIARQKNKAMEPDHLPSPCQSEQ